MMPLKVDFKSRAKMKEKTLLILYRQTLGVDEGSLFKWVEHKNKSIYRRDVLRKAHKDKLLEYDEGTKKVQISPVGIKQVEDQILVKLNG